MKIIFVAPKTTSNFRKTTTPFYYDMGYWNFYLPLIAMGHSVYFFDTTLYGNPELRNVISSFEPDLLFCAMTGNKALCPEEPWEVIKEETKKGNITTFNWFCDDSWRFEDFSVENCKYFNHCSTPEYGFVEKYKKVGYSNIHYATWCVNADIYSKLEAPRNFPISFVGRVSRDRIDYLEKLAAAEYEVVVSQSCPFETMVWVYSSSKLGLNFSKNSTGTGTQMKARMFEIPATQTCLLTEYTEGLENCFEIGKEISTFSNEDELLDKVKYFKDNPDEAKIMAANGFRRFEKDHESKIRLTALLDAITK